MPSFDISASGPISSCDFATSAAFALMMLSRHSVKSFTIRSASHGHDVTNKLAHDAARGMPSPRRRRNDALYQSSRSVMLAMMKRCFTAYFSRADARRTGRTMSRICDAATKLHHICSVARITMAMAAILIAAVKAARTRGFLQRSGADASRSSIITYLFEVYLARAESACTTTP